MEKEKNLKNNNAVCEKIVNDVPQRSWEESWLYIKAIVDVVRQPVLILDKNFRVISANDFFYREFQVEKGDAEGKIIYELGNGQWEIPALRRLLEEILPRNKFFNGFEIDYIFPTIGRKIMILNARQIQYQKGNVSKDFPSIIFLAFEDVTEMMAIAESLGEEVQRFESDFSERTQKLESRVATLEE